LTLCLRESGYIAVSEVTSPIVDVFHIVVQDFQIFVTTDNLLWPQTQAVTFGVVLVLLFFFFKLFQQVEDMGEFQGPKPSAEH